MKLKCKTTWRKFQRNCYFLAAPEFSQSMCYIWKTSQHRMFQLHFKMMGFAKYENKLNHFFITWGRNIFPAPKRSPTIFIPFIKGPSITFRGLGYFSWFNRASSVSAVTYFSMPWGKKKNWNAFIFLETAFIQLPSPPSKKITMQVQII